MEEHSFNEDFRTELEYHLSRTFENSDEPEHRGFWCDGVNEPEIIAHLNKKFVNDNRQIVTTAWIGTDGQGNLPTHNQTWQQSFEPICKRLGLERVLAVTESGTTNY